jgi:hypothetical protein
MSEIIQVTVSDATVEEFQVTINNERGPAGPAGPTGPAAAVADLSLDDSNLRVVDVTNLQTFADGVDLALFKARSTGVNTTYLATVNVGGTTFDHSAVLGEIKYGVLYYDVNYIGATGITVSDLSSSSTYVYVDNAGNLQQQTTIPTVSDWYEKVFTMRIAVDVSTNLIVSFEYLNNPVGNSVNSLRTLYDFLLAQGISFKKDLIITGRAGDLGFDVSAGSILEFGGTGEIDNPHIKAFSSVDNVPYYLLSKTAIVSGNNTDLVKFWDNADVITALGSTTVVGHRVYRYSSGNFAIQYGQANYANIVLAKAGVQLENYELNPILADATFFGWWLIESTATNTGGTTLTEFVEYTIGTQGGSSSSLSGALLRGNNFEDVLDAATALANIGGAPLVDPTFTGDVEVPAATAATHAAQVSAITSGTGQLQIGGIEMGDTGWRDISGTLAVNFSGNVYQRRVGNTVEIVCNALISNASVSAGDNIISAITAGFASGVDTFIFRPVLHTGASPAIMERSYITNTIWRTSWNGAKVLYGHFTYSTVSAWPTLLPGTAV